MCRSLFFNKVAGIKPAVTLLKKRLRHWRFPVNFANFLRTPFSVEHLWWLLLSVVMSRSFIFWEKSLFSSRKLKLQWQMLISNQWIGTSFFWYLEYDNQFWFHLISESMMNLSNLVYLRKHDWRTEEKKLATEEKADMVSQKYQIRVCYFKRNYLLHNY